MKALKDKLDVGKLSYKELFANSEQFRNMVSGKPYYDGDPLLAELRIDAQVKMQQYNKSDPFNKDLRESMIKDLFGSTGESIQVEPPFACDYGLNVFVGEGFFANFGCCILDGGTVEIGENVMFAPGVHVYTSHHPIYAKDRYEGWELCDKVVIGNEVWIGGNAIINPGVTIGSNVVIGSGSVVTKDVPSNTVVAGNPAKIVRYLNDSETTEDYMSRRKHARVCKAVEGRLETTEYLVPIGAILVLAFILAKAIQ